MQIPNLLNMALSVVGIQQFSYIKFLAREENSIGIDVTTYELPIQLNGQIQAVPREYFEKYGLDFQKTYLMFYVSHSILDVTRDVSGDQIQYSSDTYQCLSQTDWVKINGWTGVIAVKIPGSFNVSLEGQEGYIALEGNEGNIFIEGA